MKLAAPSRLFSFLRRHAFNAACAGASVVLLIAAWSLWQRQQALAAASHQRTREGEAMLATLVAGPTLRDELAQARDAVQRINANLVVEANLAENLWYFYQMEDQTKARLSDLRQLSPSNLDSPLPYKLIPYSLRITGTYEQVAAFLQRLETGPRLVVIQSFNFSRRESGSPLIGLQLDIGLLGKK